LFPPCDDDTSASFDAPPSSGSVGVTDAPVDPVAHPRTPAEEESRQ
jgi:hypothetical protein